MSETLQWDNKNILLAALLAVVVIALFLSIKRNLKNWWTLRGINKKEAAKKETSQRRYVTAKMKDRILRRDDETCQICGISRAYLDSYAEGLGDYLLLEIDHITPVAAGGRGDDEDNLQVLCWRCNRRKSGTKTNDEVYSEIDYGIEYLEEE